MLRILKYGHSNPAFLKYALPNSPIISYHLASTICDSLFVCSRNANNHTIDQAKVTPLSLIHTARVPLPNLGLVLFPINTSNIVVT